VFSLVTRTSTSGSAPPHGDESFTWSASLPGPTVGIAGGGNAHKGDFVDVQQISGAETSTALRVQIQ
jgi:hypothetical protein